MQEKNGLLVQMHDKYEGVKRRRKSLQKGKSIFSFLHSLSAEMSTLCHTDIKDVLTPSPPHEEKHL